MDHIRTKVKKGDNCLRSVFLNSDQTQQDRMIAFDKMRTLKLRCVVSTDLMSRGVDLPDVQIVINLDLPQTKSSGNWPELVHRIGRAGRFGSEALAINFIQPEELESSAKLQQFQTKSLDELTNLVISQLKGNPHQAYKGQQDTSRVENRLAKE